jgi:hypothetical protein
VKHVRKRITYANVMSSIAVFLVLGGGAAFAALGRNTVGTRQLKPNSVNRAILARNSVYPGKINLEAVKAGRIAKNAIARDRLRNNIVTTEKILDEAVTSGKLANLAVTNPKIGNNAVTGAKVNESTLSQVPSAVNASNAGLLDGINSSGFVSKPELLWALIDADAGAASIVRTRGAVAASSPGTGRFLVTFNRNIAACGLLASLGDATASVGSAGEISLDQPTGNSVEVNTYNSEGTAQNPLGSDGFYLQVTC